VLTIQAAVDRAGDEQRARRVLLFFPGKRAAGAPRRLTPISLAVKAADGKKADMMKSVMELAWKVSVIDVQHVLASACRKITVDHGASEALRMERAKALREVIGDVGEM